MQVTLKNIKNCAWVGHEGGAFQASVYIDGKRAGLVSNDGYGGCNDYEPRSLEGLLDDYAKTLPKWSFADSAEEYEQDADYLIGDLLDKAETEKWERKQCKGKTLVRFEDTKPDTWRVYKVPYSEENLAKIQKYAGKPVIECLNARYQ